MRRTHPSTPPEPSGTPGVVTCLACRELLREDRARGERVCANPRCEKYVPGAEALPEVWWR